MNSTYVSLGSLIGKYLHEHDYITSEDVDAISKYVDAVAAQAQIKIEEINNYASDAKDDIDLYSNDVNTYSESKKIEIDGIASDVNTYASEKKSDIGEYAGDVNIYATNKKAEIDTITSGVNTYANENKATIDGYTANVNTYAETNKTTITGYTDDVDAYAINKKTDIDNLYNLYADNLAAAADSNHLTQKITRTDGVHGLRWNNDAQTLQYQDSENAWQDAAAKINLTQTIDANSTDEEVPSALAVYNAGGIVVSNTQPTNTKALWIDTGHSGAARYYDGTQWAYVPAVWG